MALPNDLDIWKQLVEAKYLKEARNYSDYSRCQSCQSPKVCFNYYCLLCKVGELCPTAFRQGGTHALHPWLQVRRQTGFEAVAAKDLEHFITSVNHIHKSSLNDLDLCYLACRITELEKRPPGSIKDLKRCEICNYAIPNSKCSKEDFLVCSVECLRRMAQLHPNLNLLRMKDGAMNDMQPPKTANEKLRKATINVVVVPPAVAAPAIPLPRVARPETVTAGRGRRNPSGSEPARTKRKQGRAAAKAHKVETGTGRRRSLEVGAVERSISRSASESDEDEEYMDWQRASESDEDEQYMGRRRARARESDEDEDEQYMGRRRARARESDEDEDEQYMDRRRARARESDEDEDEQYMGRRRARARESDEDEDEQYMEDQQRAATMSVSGDPVWKRYERSCLEEVGEASGASASAKQRGKASRASAFARKRGKASGASDSARQKNRGGDEEYSCKGLDILCEIFLDGDEGKEKMHADENDE